MRLPATLCAAVLFAAGAAQAAPNLVLNGGFETTSFGTGNSEFGASFSNQSVANWTSSGTGAYNLSFNSATATTMSAVNRFNSAAEKLAPTFTGASPNGGRLVALDGDSNYRGALTQTVAGFTVGNRYELSFYWAASQLQSVRGATTEKLQATISKTDLSSPTIFETEVLSNPDQGFSGWKSVVYSFTATAATQVLSFLSIGTPNGGPPIALLDGVSITAVPEPASLALLGAGLVGVGVVRRRA